MVRAPCCEKMGLKKGPWTREEDEILVNHINLYGHGNWRALPKQAGLLRCGKSCRLRWTNYLRPDIKRGNFSREEEETIIKLHQAMGNRWSAIAARLPGRTDNEIKNVWHTHLKKRVIKNNNLKNTEAKHSKTDQEQEQEQEHEESSKFSVTRQTTSYNNNIVTDDQLINSPQYSWSEISTTTTSDSDKCYNSSMMIEDQLVLAEDFPELDENFWSEVFSGGEVPVVQHGVEEFENFALSESGCVYKSNMHDDLDFWFNVFTRAGELPELPEF